MTKVTNLPSISSFFAISAASGVTVLRPLKPKSGLIIESPHSSLHDPEDAYNYAGAPASTSPMTDKFIDALILEAPYRYSVVVNNVSRIYVDPNRRISCINLDHVSDPENVPDVVADKFTNTSMWLVNMFGRDKLADNHPGRFITSQEIETRRTHWRNYHKALGEEINNTHSRFGESLHISAHSYPGSQMREWKRLKAYDVIIGNINGQTSSPDVLNIVVTAFKRQGFRVLVNDIFMGQESVHQHSNPEQGKHAVQIEIDRRLYMNVNTFQLHPEEEFNTLKTAINIAFEEIGCAMNERINQRIYQETFAAKFDQPELAAE